MLIAQITDTHIVEKGSHWLFHPLTKTEKRLSRTIEYLNALNPAPDVVLITGDLTDQGSPLAYAHFREIAANLKLPLYVIAGNHDRREEMRLAFADSSYLPKSGFLHYAIDEYPLRLIGLDTLVEGKALGSLCLERVSWLEKKLQEDPEKPTLLFMHHPPAKTGVKVFDDIICLADPRFEEVVLQAKNIVGIVCGHYHHFCLNSFAGKPCFIAPSVVPPPYFTHPGDEELTAIEIEDPAVSLHQWEKGRGLISHFFRVKEKPHLIDWSIIKSMILAAKK